MPMNFLGFFAKNIDNEEIPELENVVEFTFDAL